MEIRITPMLIEPLPPAFITFRVISQTATSCNRQRQIYTNEIKMMDRRKSLYNHNTFR